MMTSIWLEKTTRTTTTLKTTRETAAQAHVLLLTRRYSDEEDVSWKIRRSAAKVIYALIGTRNELLVEFYKVAAPTLIGRFSEREESVRLEILGAVEALLKQTAQVRAADAAANGRNKRKRSHEMDQDDTEER